MKDRTTDIMRPRFELPLLGSNQDSSDPESEENRGLIAGTGLESRPNTPETRPNDPGITHSSTHKEVAAASIPTWLLPPYLDRGALAQADSRQ